MKKKDTRHILIGGKHRAYSRYAMIVHRTTHTNTSRNKGYLGVKVLVTKDEFTEWFMGKDFPGCSVDRIDSSGHYEISNMQLISLAKNIAKEKSKHIDGFCVCYACKQQKPSGGFASDSRNQTFGKSTLCKLCDSKRIKNESKTARENRRVGAAAYYQSVTKQKKAADRSSGT